MDLFEAITKRRSVRKYRPEPVTEEQLERLIEAARWAPTGANLQPWKFIIVTDPELRQRLSSHAKFYFVQSHHVAEAPAMIAICGNLKKSKWAPVDCALAGENLMLAATAMGLGSCWVGIFDEEKVKELLEIPDGYKVVGLVTVGYADEEATTPKKLGLEEILFYEKFGERTFLQRADEYRRSGPTTVLKKVLKLVLRL